MNVKGLVRELSGHCPSQCRVRGGANFGHRHPSTTFRDTPQYIISGLTDSHLLRGMVYTRPRYLLFLQVLHHLLHLGIGCQAEVREGTLRTLHEETAQRPSRYCLVGIDEQRAYGRI